VFNRDDPFLSLCLTGANHPRLQSGQGGISASLQQCSRFNSAKQTSPEDLTGSSIPIPHIQYPASSNQYQVPSIKYPAFENHPDLMDE